MTLEMRIRINRILFGGIKTRKQTFLPLKIKQLKRKNIIRNLQVDTSYQQLAGTMGNFFFGSAIAIFRIVSDHRGGS